MMRRVFEHRDEAHAVGTHARKDLLARFTPAATVSKFMAAVRAVVQS
jgi:hypothetical protein